MNRIKKDQHENKCGCFLITVSSIIFAIIFIMEQVNLTKILPDFEEQKSELSTQYYDQMAMNRSFISFAKFDLDLMNNSIFSNDMTEAKWEPKKIKNDIENREKLLNNKCQKCGTEFQNPSSNSSKRDLVLSYFSGVSAFKMRFVSSLRAAGCQATIVIFLTDKAQQAISSINSIIENCGVITIQIGDFLDPYSRNKEISYHILFNEFLKEYRSNFDRVIIFESAAPLAQSDPFTTYFTYSTVGVTTLDYDQKLSYEESGAISSVDSNYSSEFYTSHSPFLSSSVLYGSVDGILMLYGIMFKHKNFVNKFFDSETPLSSYLNYYYHRGIFEKEGLNIFVAIPGNFICSVGNSDQLRIVNKYYFASPLDVKRKIYFTMKYYRERHILYTVANAMNPPSIITISESDPFSGIHFLSCSNIQYKKRSPHRSKKIEKPVKDLYQRSKEENHLS